MADPTDTQWSRLMDAVWPDPELRGEPQGPGAHGRVLAKWDAIATMLNGLGGAFKSGEKWKEAFNNLKSRAKRQYNERARYLKGTGGGPPPAAELGMSPIYQRALSFVPKEQLLGHNVPEPLQLQQQMAHQVPAQQLQVPAQQLQVPAQQLQVPAPAQQQQLQVPAPVQLQQQLQVPGPAQQQQLQVPAPAQQQQLQIPAQQQQLLERLAQQEQQLVQQQEQLALQQHQLAQQQQLAQPPAQHQLPQQRQLQRLQQLQQHVYHAQPVWDNDAMMGEAACSSSWTPSLSAPYFGVPLQQAPTPSPAASNLPGHEALIDAIQLLTATMASLSTSNMLDASEFQAAVDKFADSIETLSKLN